jgi:hypothetical protein
MARRIQAERFCDLGWDIACEVTPETAFATKVKLEQLRWTAASMAPKRYGRFRAVRAEVEDGDDNEPLTVVIKQFSPPPGEVWARVEGPSGE